MVYEYESKLKNRLLDLEFDTWEETAQFEREYRELEEVYRKARAFEEVKKYALSKYDEFEGRKDTARSNKEFNYFNTLQIANKAIINNCKQLEDE